ncbi:uncharacterized protein K452DRAFT_112205 [Aplosporella prunicola CBS 121167]|uniref:Uncharacterized protein n=1 Tax=Aplosporella prunicola CBS 121167 TaxID=1176127 RepID=A0A6A6B1V2_9PEZI|nr:uncharacterized protein K452DRAFT_112205 [Aplosporella prunicola CBS 121167]KAF2137204.1 hypothetical protein K452DRAFT_112205 [Aplosporella prunicola CBS 121167]
MDSMRSLNTSLPSATSRRRPGQTNAALLQAFKTAALQVTNLYKAAASDREATHDEGYQACLEDMLSFLDAENLGVGDGEGWRIRQWVTEKLQEGTTATDSDEEGDDDKRGRSSSPAAQRRPSPEAVASPAVQALRSASPARADSAPPAPVATVPAAAPSLEALDALPKGDFTFRAPQTLDLDMDETEQADSNAATNAGSPPMQINVFPRHRTNRNSSNNTHARTTHNRDRQAAAAVASLGSLGSGAGVKRRVPFGDYFDINGFGNGKDVFGGHGSKRGRFT